MFQVLAIGNIGGNATVKGDQGREFVTFRIAHNERYKDQQGVEHDNTLWVDCVMNGRPAVLPYLKAGQLVLVQGNASLRVYDSAKDHCKKAGIQVNVLKLELLGSNENRVPTKLYDSGGAEHAISRYYLADVKGSLLQAPNGDKYVSDDDGWVVPLKDAPAEVQQQLNTTANGK